LASNRWNRTDAQFEFEMFEAASLEDAKQLAQEYS
jgi:hypothetical protein